MLNILLSTFETIMSGVLGGVIALAILVFFAGIAQSRAKHGAHR